MMSNEPLPAPIYIDTAQALEQLIAALQSEKRVAVDTESDSLYVYHEKVCLIQFSTPAHDYLLDPLSGVDISPLGTIFSNPNIEKIFHAAEYDVICLRRDFGFEFNHLFDTMQAARVIGFPKLGLSSLLEEYFGVMVNKRYQKANWGKRPLSQEMLDYARLDTHYLIPLREILFSRLEKLSRVKVAQEDFIRLSRVVAAPNDKPCYMSVRGYHTLDPQQLAILNEVCIYRERIASQADLPPFKILGSKVLLETARHNPTSKEDLSNIPGLSPKLLHRHAKGLLEAVKNGQAQPPLYLNHHNKPSEAYIARLEHLKSWRLQRARKKGVASDVVLPREMLEELAKKNPKTDSELAALMQDMPERFRLYHTYILDTLRGERS